MAFFDDLKKKYTELLSPVKQSLSDNKGWFQQGQFTPQKQVQNIARNVVSGAKDTYYQAQQNAWSPQGILGGSVNAIQGGINKVSNLPRLTIPQSVKSFATAGQYDKGPVRKAAIDLAFAVPESIANIPRNYAVGTFRTGQELGTAYKEQRPLNLQNLAGGIAPLAESLVDVGTFGGFTVAKGLAKEGAKQGIKQAILKQGAKGAGLGALGGLTYGLDTQYGKKFNTDEVAQNIVGGALLGGTLGGVTGGAGAVASKIYQGYKNIGFPDELSKDLTKKHFIRSENVLVKPRQPKAQVEFNAKVNTVLGRKLDTPVYSDDLKAYINKTNKFPDTEIGVGMTTKNVNRNKVLSPETQPIKTGVLPAEGAAQAQLQKTIQKPVLKKGIDNATLPVPGKIIQPTKSLQKSPQDMLPQRGFAQTIIDDPTISKEVKAFASDLTYEPLKNKDVLKTVSKIVQRGDSQAISFAKTDDTVNGNATAMLMVRKLLNKGRFDEATDLIATVSPRFTKQGQQIQILSQFGRLTPEGAVRYAQNIIDKANKANPRLKLKLTPQNTEEITKLAQAIKPLAEGSRERTVAIAQLIQKISDKVPSSIGQKISAIQTMAQLLNIKTGVRNVLGNTIFTVADNVSDVVATGVDRVVSLMTGKRTKVLPSLKVQLKGAITGLKEGAEDVRLGIDTSGGVASQFDLNTKTFTDPILGTLEKGLNYSLRVPDRAAYKAAFEGSLDNQMRAMGVKNPTPEMAEIAHLDGLYRTFQDNSTLARFFSGIKQTFNKIGTPDGKFGLGDLVLKYPKTPANLLSRGLDYSPVGFLKGIYQTVRPMITGQPFNQKQFVENLSRAMVGTGLISAGYVLAEKGIITGKSEKDYDISSVQKTTGQGPFKINVDALKRYFASGGKKQDVQDGDTLVTYDWAQPMSLSVAIGANSALGGKAEQAIESLQAGIDTITGQPMVKNLVDAASTVKNKGIVPAIRDIALNSASGFNPSIIRQTSNVFDPLQRSTYNPDPVKESLSKIQAGIPAARNQLEPKINVFGEQMVNYGGGGLQRLFDIFINPAFVSKVKENPVAKEVLDIYQRSGETQQAPRIAEESVKINGSEIKLDPEQYTKYQTYIGKKTNEMFNQLIADPLFTKSSDDDKAKFLASVLTDINSAAKIELFGNAPKNTSDNVKRIIQTTSGGQDSTILGGVGITKDGNLKLTGGSIPKPTLTGDSIVDKKLISSYNSDVNAQIKDLINLYNTNNISATELKEKVSSLEKLKITRPKKSKKITIKKPKALKLKSIKIKKIKMPKIKKVKKLKMPKRVKLRV